MGRSRILVLVAVIIEAIIFLSLLLPFTLPRAEVSQAAAFLVFFARPPSRRQVHRASAEGVARKAHAGFGIGKRAAQFLEADAAHANQRRSAPDLFRGVRV